MPESKNHITLAIVTGLAVLTVFCSACRQQGTLFIPLSPSETNVHFSNHPVKRNQFGILYYIYYYNGGGVATGDINNDGLPDIYFTANDKGKNKLYLNKGNFVFEDITHRAGVAGTADWCSGVTMADINGDGFLDIYVSAISGDHELKGRNELYINNGPGADSGQITFTESAAAYGLDFSGFSTQAAFFDYDRDGDLDCYLLNQSQRPNENIVDTGNRRKTDKLYGDRLYRNDAGAGRAIHFTDVSALAGIYQSSLGYGLGLAIADLNNDGWDDIYVGNDFHENDYYYVNNGNGTFTESGARVFSHYSRFSMGNDIADYNNDGHADIITADMLPPDEKVLKTYGSDENADIYKFKILDNGFQHQYSKNCLQRNNGNGTSFSETALLSGVAATDWSWAPLFADFNNDGNKDLLITSGIVRRPVDLDFVRYVSDLYVHRTSNNADKYDAKALEKMPDGSSHPYLFKGDGKLAFTDVSKAWGTGHMKGYFTGASYADLNNDGRLDCIINAIDQPALILKNKAPEKNYLSISFRGDQLNKHGIGAKAYLFHNGRLQYQQLMGTRGFQSSCELRLHFGLDMIAVADSLLIIWPDQRYEIIKNVAADAVITVQQKNATGHFNYADFFKSPEPQLIEKTSGLSCAWQHRENNFFDYNTQYLIPHCQSARGPKIAVGDVNNDGLDDFYACGALGQPGALMVQQASGKFVQSDTSTFRDDALYEDADAVFFDADNDADLDLLVASGGNQYSTNNPYLADRLYMNDGKGNFIRSAGMLPEILHNKSCLAIADVDNDGDTDLFTGVLADANAYGIPQTSYLLLNNGKGKFSIAPGNRMALNDLGIVTAAKFADLNSDQRPDLVVTGEWMPLIVYLNRGERFEKQVIPGSTGLWQTIFTDDVNGDGHTDVLAGNWGYNNKFKSGKNGPLRLYVDDFDNNGRTDQLMSYTLNGTEFPFLAKDEVERPLPLLKKHYLLYADYAGVPMKEVFYGWIDTVKPLMAERLGSALCLNNGNGSFVLHDLPAGLQLAPIMAFQKLDAVANKRNCYITGGNFFDVIPYEGRYDAQPLALFTAGPAQEMQYLHQPRLLEIKGQVRDIKRIKTAKGYMLIVARNNDSLLFYERKQ